MRNTAHKTGENIKWHYPKYKILSAAIFVGLRLYLYIYEWISNDRCIFTLDLNNMTPGYLKKRIKTKATSIKIKTEIYKKYVK